MKSLYPISLLLAACSLLTAQDTMPTRSLRGTGRPRTTTSTAPQIYLSSTIAGTPGTSGYAGDTGAATAALLSSPLAVAMDSKGNIYTGEVDTGKRAQKFVLKNGDGKARLHPHE